MADEECLCDLVSESAQASESLFAVLGDVLASVAVATAFTVSTVGQVVPDQASAAEVVEERAAYIVVDSAQASDWAGEAVLSSNLVTDRARAREAIFHGVLEVAGDQAAAGEWMVEMPKASVLDSARASEEITGNAIGRLALTDAAQASGGFILGAQDLVEDAAAGTEQVVAGARVAEVVEDQAVASDALEQESAVTADLVDDVLHATELAQGTVAGGQVVDDWGHAESEAVQGEHVVWTCHTQTFGMSRLTLPEVNSFAAVGGLLLAAGPDGLYVADGAPLQSLVVTGLVDFGSPQLKRGGYLYLRYVAAGQLGVSVGVTSTGSEVTYDYALAARPDAAAVPGRVKLGKGLRSRDWRFTLRNEPGRGFKLYDLQLMQDETSRRV